MSVPLSQLPLRTTSPAFGASSRNVTRLSEITSGDTTRDPCGACGPRACGCCARAELSEGSTATAVRQGQGAPSPPQPPDRGNRGARGANPAGGGTIVRGPNGEMWGYSDSAFNAGSRWRIHDPDRPQPPVVTAAGPVTIPPPS